MKCLFQVMPTNAVKIKNEASGLVKFHHVYSKRKVMFSQASVSLSEKVGDVVSR